MSKLDLAELLSFQIDKISINRSQLAKQARISRQTLYKLLNAEIEEAKLSTLVRLSHALHLSPVEVMKVFFNASSLSIHKSDNTGLMGDITFPDNSIVTPNQVFTKTWAVKNTGDIIWKHRKLICIDDRIIVTPRQETDTHVAKERGLIPLVSEIDIPTTLPNESIELSVQFKAPSYACTTISYWKSVDEHGNFLFPEKEGLSCLVNVVSP